MKIHTLLMHYNGFYIAHAANASAIQHKSEHKGLQMDRFHLQLFFNTGRMHAQKCPDCMGMDHMYKGHEDLQYWLNEESCWQTV